MRAGRGATGDRGASILELALITPLMAVVVMGVLDLTRAHQLQIRLENAAREGAAYAQLHPNQVSCTSASDVRDRAGAEDDDLPSVPGYNVLVLAENASGDVVVPVTGCDSSAAENGERVRVEVSARFDLVTPFVSNLVGGSIDMTGSAEVEVQG